MHPIDDDLSRWIRGIPSDLATVIVAVVLIDLAYLIVPFESTVLRLGLGFPLLFFLPGYALVVALYPARHRSNGRTELRRTGPGTPRRFAPDGIERLALSFGMSVALLPMLGLVLAATPWGFSPMATIVALSSFVGVVSLVGIVRRVRLPPNQRFEVPFRRWGRSVQEFVVGDSRRTTAVNLALVLSVLIATSTIGFAFAFPQQGETYSNLQLLTENEDGELVASGYPTEFEHGEQAQLTVSLDNMEHEETTYTLVVELERVDRSGESITVLETRELDRMETTLSHGETWRNQHTVQPDLIGDDLRLNYYLYRGDAPDDASAETAYRHAYLWISVEDPDAATDE